MDIKKILLPEKIETHEMLYYRKPEDAAVLEDGSIQCAKDAEVEFNTYFNGFSIGIWKKYTVLEQLSLALTLQGNFCVSLRWQYLDRGGMQTKVITEANVSSDKPEQFLFHFGEAKEKGMFYFVCRSLRDGSRIVSGKYLSEHLTPLNLNIHLAADICTFKKEKFVERNLRVLKNAILDNPDSVLYRRLYVFISDNAGTLDKSLADSEYIQITPSPNVGGVGGFTRGIINAKAMQKARDLTHVVLMDDDAVLEPASLEMNYTFLTIQRPEYKDYVIGGGILRLDEPNCLYEAGAQWNRGAIRALHHYVDLRWPENLLRNELEDESVEYSGWWYTCMALDSIDRDNLPLPIFIHRDDVEYGLRVGQKRFIYMNGIGVWHEAFETKMAGVLEYYDIRNHVITNAIHCPDYSAKEFKRFLIKWVSGNIGRYRYRYVDMNLRGAMDFLKGVDGFKEIQTEALHKELLAFNYKAKPKSEYIGYHGITEEDYNWEKLMDPDNFREIPKKIRMAQIALFNGYFLPAKKNKAVVVAPYFNVYKTFRVPEIIFTDALGNSIYTKRSRKEFFRCYWNLFRVCRMIDRDYEKAKNSFHDRYHELTSMSFWKKYLEMD